MVQSDKDACYLNYAYHLNHNILDTCLMQTTDLRTVFQTPKVQRQFPRYQYSQLLMADPTHSLAYSAYATPRPRDTNQQLPNDMVLIDAMNKAETVKVYRPLQQCPSKKACSITRVALWLAFAGVGLLAWQAWSSKR